MFKKGLRTFAIKLRTLLPEIESILNARPLIYVFDDQEEISYPLTQAQLIYGRNLTTCNDKHFEVLSTNKALTKHVNCNRRLLEQFSTRWKTEYLQNLHE